MDEETAQILAGCFMLALEAVKDKLDKEYDEVRKSELLTEIENVSKSFKPVMTNVTRFE